uniref:Uncharacterized protein n=1 Tax=Hyaloperonospora arabidopsidis (strain Emoy2) TaxID=559515 RepID=M4BQY4_HYAAE
MKTHVASHFSFVFFSRSRPKLCRSSPGRGSVRARTTMERRDTCSYHHPRFVKSI